MRRDLVYLSEGDSHTPSWQRRLLSLHSVGTILPFRSLLSKGHIQQYRRRYRQRATKAHHKAKAGIPLRQRTEKPWTTFCGACWSESAPIRLRRKQWCRFRAVRTTAVRVLNMEKAASRLIPRRCDRQMLRPCHAFDVLQRGIVQVGRQWRQRDIKLVPRRPADHVMPVHKLHSQPPLRTVVVVGTVALASWLGYCPCRAHHTMSASKPQTILPTDRHVESDHLPPKLAVCRDMGANVERRKQHNAFDLPRKYAHHFLVRDPCHAGKNIGENIGAAVGMVREVWIRVDK